MRKFVIRSFELLLAFGVLGAIAGVAYYANFWYSIGETEMAVVVTVVGLVCVILMFGLVYLLLGIYHNTRRMADILQARRGEPDIRTPGLRAPDAVEPDFSDPRIEPIFAER